MLIKYTGKYVNIYFIMKITYSCYKLHIGIKMCAIKFPIELNTFQTDDKDLLSIGISNSLPLTMIPFLFPFSWGLLFSFSSS